MDEPDGPRSQITGNQIPGATVGEPVRIDGTIELHESDPSWRDLYLREQERIRAVLGDRVRLLEHVGSTSVPGLAAKPVIDMVLAVTDSADEGSYVPYLESEGYTLRIREPGWFEHRMFKGPDTDVNLHVFTEGAAEIDRMIRFRDHLTTHPDDRERYAAAKRTLASKEWAYVQDYADAKSGVVTEILDRAIRPADASGEGSHPRPAPSGAPLHPGRPAPARLSEREEPAP